MATQLQIVNLALTRLGVPRIASMSEQSKAALAATAVWEFVRDEVLAKHPWNRATQRADLRRVTDAAKIISGVSVAANAVVTTTKPHGYLVDDQVLVIGVEGCLDDDSVSVLNGFYHTVTAVTATTFTISTSTAGATAYVQDGLAMRVRKMRLGELGTSITQTVPVSSCTQLTTVAEAAAGVTPTNFCYEPGDVRRYGAMSGGAAGTNTTAFQNALNTGHALFVPNGIFEINASLTVASYARINFESRNAILKANLTSALIKSATAETSRIYEVQLWSGRIDNTSRANSGSIAIDLRNVSMCKVFGTLITNVETGVRINAPVSGGAYYNEFHGVDITTVDIGYELGTLGNENKVFGGRVNDSEIGARINDNTGNVFEAVAIETFTTFGVDVAPTTATQYTRIMGCRFENAPTSGTGVRISANAQATTLVSPQFTGLTTKYTNAIRDTVVLSDEQLLLRHITSGAAGRAITGHYQTTAVIDFPSIAAGATNDQLVTITGAVTTDTVIVTPPAALEAGLMCACLPASGGVYVRLANVTGVSIDPASATYTIDIWRH